MGDPLSASPFAGRRSGSALAFCLLEKPEQQKNPENAFRVRHPALFLRKSARGDGRNGGHLFPALYKNAGIASHLPKGILSPVCPRRLDLLPRWFCACFSCFTAGMFTSFPEKRSASVYMVREDQLHFIVRTQENSHTPFGTDPRIGCASLFARSSSERRGGQRPGGSLFPPRGSFHFVPGPRMDVRLSGFCRVETSPGSWPK